MARTVVGLAILGDVVACAGAVDLQVTDRALGVDSRESCT